MESIAYQVVQPSVRCLSPLHYQKFKKLSFYLEHEELLKPVEYYLCKSKCARQVCFGATGEAEKSSTLLSVTLYRDLVCGKCVVVCWRLCFRDGLLVEEANEKV